MVLKVRTHTPFVPSKVPIRGRSRSKDPAKEGIKEGIIRACLHPSSALFRFIPSPFRKDDVAPLLPGILTAA